MIKKTIFMAGLYITFLFATTGNTESSTNQCPPERYRANGSCLECPPGKIGFNCSLPCEPMHYGRGCRSTCGCLLDLCDPKIGCIDTSTGGLGIPCRIGYYKEANGKCVVCPPGTIGRNCSDTCPKGSYGLKCVHTCTCMDCDPVTGCPTQDTTFIGETVSATSTDVPPAEGPVHTVISLVLLIVILTIVGCNFAASVSLLWRFTTKFYLPQHQDKTAKESTAQGTIEEIEMSPDAYESPIIPTERQEMRVYTELN